MIGVVLIALGSAVGYLTKDALIPFNPTPVELPIVVRPGFTADRAFGVGHGAMYQVEFDCENPKGLRPFQYSAWQAAVESVEIQWSVTAGARKVAGGRSSEYAKNSYGRAGGIAPPRSGRVIGQFTADAGTKYLLHVQVTGGDSTLSADQPRVNVMLNGQELSDLSDVEDVRQMIHAKVPWIIGLGAAMFLLALLGQVFGKTSAPA